MSEFSRGPNTKTRNKFYVTNRGSDSEGSDDADSFQKPNNFHSSYHFGYSYHHPRPPLPKPPAPAPTPLTTTNIVQPRYQTSHPSLSSPSSTSSPAAEESTPPPSTPSLPVPPVDLTADDPSVPDIPQISTSRKLIQTLKSPFHKANHSRPLAPSPTKRPSTSPTASTPDSYSSNGSYASSSSTVSDRTLILVTGDSERYVNVDITGATTAAFIRECLFTKLNIFEEEDQAQYSIYQTEIGAFAIGEALSDERLFELCRQHGDARGSLKLLVSHNQASVHDPLPSALSPPAHTLLPPVVLPHYSSTGIQPLQPRRRPPSRHGSQSSASEYQPMEVAAGYEADLDNPERDNHRTTMRPSQQQQLLSAMSGAGVPSLSPHGARRAASPLRPPSRPNTPPSLPPPPPTQSTPIGTETTTIFDQYGRILPPPPPPPPLSPNRSTFAFEDNSLTPPANHHFHVRSGSDATADRNDLTKSEQPADSQSWRPQQLASSSGRSRPEHQSKERRHRPKAQRNEYEERSDPWILVRRQVDSPRSSNESDVVSPSTLHDGTRASPSTSRARQHMSPSRYKSSTPYGRGLAIPAAPRNAPPTVPTVSPESRMPTSSTRQAGQPVPANWAVSWKGEGSGVQKPLPSTSSSSWSRLNKGTKSMDNLRAAAYTHPPMLQPGGGARRSPATSTNRMNGNMPFLPSSYTSGRDAGMPKSYDGRPAPRPLPLHGSSHGTASFDLAQGQYTGRTPGYPANGFTSPEPYPRPLSAFGDVAPSPSQRYPGPLQSPTYSSGPTLDPLDPIRALSPVRQAGISRPSIGVSYGSADLHVSPPRSPTSPRSPHQAPSLDAERRTDQDDHPWMTSMLNGVDSADSTLVPAPRAEQSSTGASLSRPYSRSSYDDSDSDADETGTSMWKKPPVFERPASTGQRPPLTVQIENSTGVHTLSIPSSTSKSASTGSATLLGPRPRSPSLESTLPGTITPHTGKTRLRGSTFTERDSSWAPRPPPEDVYERLEEFFPEHDLDQPVIEASSGGTSPTSAEPVIPPPPPMPASNPEKDTTISALKSSGIKGKKSIRIVAEEHKKRIDRTSRAGQTSFSATVLRKRSTKLWGSRLEEVTTAHGTESISHSESQSGSSSTFKWVRGELIGRGTYGRVYLAMNATTGEMIAVKQVEIPRTASDKNDSRQVTVVQALKLESETLKDLDHPNIVQYLGFEETPTNLSIFLEYVPGGSIGSCLLKHGKFDEEVTKSFTSQILSGLEYLHSKGILHRDLKADNILVEVSGVCKISDFGISKRTTEITGGAAITAMQGTVFWMAPEVVNPQGRGYNFKVDIWSVGCVVLEMWAGMRPWQGDEVVAVMFKLYQSKLPPPVPEDVVLSELADDFRRKCFAINPEERPTAAELRRHKYLELTPGWVFTAFK